MPIMCTKYCTLITFGIISMFIGFVMTMYGYLHTPFWSEHDAQGCSFCKDDREATLRSIKNTKIAGPIFLIIGVFMIAAGILFRRRYLDDLVKQGAARPGVTTYSAAGPISGSYPSTAAAYPSQHVTYPQGAQYPSQASIVPPQSTQYPPPGVSNYVPQSGQYPPPAGQYTPLLNGNQYPSVGGQQNTSVGGQQYPPPVFDQYPVPAQLKGEMPPNYAPPAYETATSAPPPSAPPM